MNETANYKFDIRGKCVDRCLSFLNSVKEVGEIKFEKVIGKSETYYKSQFEHKGHTIEIYIYRDGAEFIVDNDYNPRIEWYEGISEEELIESFMSKLEKYIYENKA